MKWLRSHAISVEIAWILRGTCVEYDRNIRERRFDFYVPVFGPGYYFICGADNTKRIVELS